jgi:hypothetical protein
MKTTSSAVLVREIVVAIVLGVVGIAGLMLAHAQQTGTSGTTTRKNAEAISPELAAELKLVEQLPTVEQSTLPYDGRGGTYYSAQCPYWPPLPDNIFNLPVWNLGDGYYLLNDLAVDYPALSATTAATMSDMARPMGGGRFSPDFSTDNGPYLTIGPTGTNGVFLITVFNNTGPANYELWWTPVLANPDYPWTAIAVGNTGQTNFTVTTTYPTAFYRAVWDTNSIPLWEAADPNNPGAGILSVFIDSPTNGAVLQ